jgi:hypothetical protein
MKRVEVFRSFEAASDWTLAEEASNSPYLIGLEVVCSSFSLCEARLLSSASPIVNYHSPVRSA